MTEWIDAPDDIKPYAGFVYRITCMVTGKYYIGQKKFWSQKHLKTLSGKINRRLVTKESDWKAYHGSSMELLQDIKHYGKEQFRRKILFCCKKKSQMNYIETYLQFKNNVLYDDNSYNKNINCRISSNQLGVKWT